MLAKERQLKIIKQLKTHKFCTVKELCGELNASPSTIQRDLEALQDQGKLIREHGGATLIDVGKTISAYDEISVTDKSSIHAAEKIALCEEAAKEIKNGDCIFLDSGTTLAYIAPFLENKEITIVTNSLLLAGKLVDNSYKVLLLGGELKQKYALTLGSVTLEECATYHFDKAFLSSNGVSLDNGDIYGSEIEINAVKKSVMKNSREIYLLFDASKTEVIGLHAFGNLKNMKRAYTNSRDERVKDIENIMVCDCKTQTRRKV